MYWQNRREEHTSLFAFFLVIYTVVLVTFSINFVSAIKGSAVTVSPQQSPVRKLDWEEFTALYRKISTRAAQPCTEPLEGYLAWQAEYRTWAENAKQWKSASFISGSTPEQIHRAFQYIDMNRMLESDFAVIQRSFESKYTVFAFQTFLSAQPHPTTTFNPQGLLKAFGCWVWLWAATLMMLGVLFHEKNALGIYFAELPQACAWSLIGPLAFLWYPGELSRERFIRSLRFATYACGMLLSSVVAVGGGPAIVKAQTVKNDGKGKQAGEQTEAEDDAATVAAAISTLNRGRKFRLVEYAGAELLPGGPAPAGFGSREYAVEAAGTIYDGAGVKIRHFTFNEDRAGTKYDFFNSSWDFNVKQWPWASLATQQGFSGYKPFVSAGVTIHGKQIVHAKQLTRPFNYFDVTFLGRVAGSSAKREVIITWGTADLNFHSLQVRSEGFYRFRPQRGVGDYGQPQILIGRKSWKRFRFLVEFEVAGGTITPLFGGKVYLR